MFNLREKNIYGYCFTPDTYPSSSLFDFDMKYFLFHILLFESTYKPPQAGDENE